MDLYFSNAGRWMHCAASVEPSERNVAYDPTTAAEGKAAHHVGECVLAGDAHSADEFEGEYHAGVEITPEMINSVNEYADRIRPIFNAAYDYGVEVRADYCGARGRLDVFARNLGKLTIGDFKYGFRRVSPVNNWQLILGALSQWKSERVVEMFVYSPRANPSDPWQVHTIGYSEMLTLGKQVHSRITALDMGERGEVAGSHCVKCPHAHDCNALGDWIEQNMDTKDLNELHTLQKLIKTRVTAIETDLESRLYAGEFVPGWTLEPRQGNRQFKHDAPTIEITTGMKATKPVPLSPNEMQQRGVPRKKLDELTYRPFAGHKLQPWSADMAAKLFGK